jgi:hypothetical protein
MCSILMEFSAISRHTKNVNISIFFSKCTTLEFLFQTIMFLLVKNTALYLSFKK